MKSFKQYISEANYGALQSDKRIIQLRDMVKVDLRQEWRKKKDTDVNLLGFDFFVSIRKDPREYPEGKIFVRGSHSIINRTMHRITIYINPEIDYQTAIQRIDEINPTLSHEIKHYLDVKDGRFTGYDDGYVDADKNEYKKYVTQIQEINNFLITVLEDLALVRQANPKISFEDALQESFWWKHLIETALYDYKNLNKFKSKLATFWNKKQTPKEEDTKSLRLQLMLLLYQWHKDGDIKKAKDMGMNVAKILKQNVERMSPQGLKDNIEKFKKLVSERE